jgi:hypothetical protein
MSVRPSVQLLLLRFNGPSETGPNFNAARRRQVQLLGSTHSGPATTPIAVKPRSVLVLGLLHTTTTTTTTTKRKRRTINIGRRSHLASSQSSSYASRARRDARGRHRGPVPSAVAAAAAAADCSARRSAVRRMNNNETPRSRSPLDAGHSPVGASCCVGHTQTHNKNNSCAMQSARNQKGGAARRGNDSRARHCGKEERVSTHARTHARTQADRHSHAKVRTNFVGNEEKPTSG